ncbi:MAG: aminopeptidase N [Alphaproteobacteria bacterium]|nr:aminopeptidase N [Alphaproteobacteria bacterium]
MAASAPKQEKRLADYRAPDFELEHVKLIFRLFENYAEVEAVTHFRMKGEAGKCLTLDGSPYMSLEAISIDGVELGEDQYVQTPDSLTLRAVPEDFSLKIITKLQPKENTRLEGLYFSGGNFCTQCEAEGFRHITYFPDRPDVLAKYDVRIEADANKYPVLLSNGNPATNGALDRGRHYAEWEDPHPKPSYLFALVAGDLACLSDSYKTKSGRPVALNIYVAPKDLDKSDYAMQSLIRAMKWDEDVYGLEYDLDVYNIVAVSDFNMGAMENKGLNIFNTKYVLASPETATDADFDHVEGVIGHEYFHNWTGNRITCRDWFQLSLKEGLTVFRDQEFSSDMTSRAVKRLDDVRVLRMLQFPEDAGPLAHPIRPEKYIEINNFYTTTVYNKGAEVIRMIHRLLGADAFQEGMRIYFDRHDGKAATCEDFVAAMEAGSGKDLQQFRLWYSQAGTPKLTVKREWQGDDLTLTIEQSSAPSPGQAVKAPYHMPVVVGFVGNGGQDIQPEVEDDAVWTPVGCTLDLKKARQVFTFRDVPKDAVPSLLRGFSAPVVLEHDLNDNELAVLASHDSDAFVRWEATQDLYSRYLLKQISEDTTANTVPTHLSAVFTSHLEDRETDPALLAELISLPSEVALGQKMETLQPEAIHATRKAFMATLAGQYSEAILQQYRELEGSQFSLEQSAKAKRRLRNALLGYVMLLPEGEECVKRHYETANNMTDCMAALGQISHSEFGCRQAVLDAFYEKWSANELVVDKWFAVQAQSSRPDTVAQVERLLEHPAFKMQNPNRLRSLVSTFSMLNQVRFHDESGEGYRFLANMIVQVDKINPQTAARLVPPLGRWGRLDEVRRTYMKDALRAVLETSDLSDDVRELAEKSLT